LCRSNSFRVKVGKLDSCAWVYFPYITWLVENRRQYRTVLIIEGFLLYREWPTNTSIDHRTGRKRQSTVDRAQMTPRTQNIPARTGNQGRFVIAAIFAGPKSPSSYYFGLSSLTGQFFRSVTDNRCR
jgi:hypothetical protein